MSWPSSELKARLAPLNWFKPSRKVFLLAVPSRYFFCRSFVLFTSCVFHAFTSVHYCLVGNGLTSWLLFGMLNCVFVSLPCGILGQVQYLIVSIPGLCHLSYFKDKWQRLSQFFCRVPRLMLTRIEFSSDHVHVKPVIYAQLHHYIRNSDERESANEIMKERNVRKRGRIHLRSVYIYTFLKKWHCKSVDNAISQHAIKSFNIYYNVNKIRKRSGTQVIDN